MIYRKDRPDQHHAGGGLVTHTSSRIPHRARTDLLYSQDGVESMVIVVWVKHGKWLFVSMYRLGSVIVVWEVQLSTFVRDVMLKVKLLFNGWHKHKFDGWKKFKVLYNYFAWNIWLGTNLLQEWGKPFICWCNLDRSHFVKIWSCEVDFNLHQKPKGTRIRPYRYFWQN